MINETLIKIFYKGDDDVFLADYPVFQTDEQFYHVDLGGFDILESVDLSEYQEYKHGHLQGLRISDVFTNGYDLYIRFVDDQIISLSIGDGGINFRLEGSEAYEGLKEWFESAEPREDHLQKLTKEHPRWTIKMVH